MKSMSLGALICIGLIGSNLSVNAQENQSAEQTDKSEEPAKKQTWKERSAWQGDFRLRYEGIDEAGEEERNRFRFRGRFRFDTELTDTTQFSMRLATSNGSPVSTNLTFGNGFSSKDIALDRAFVTWNVSGGLDLAFGKMGSPWYRAGGNSLLWDNDLNPEGIVAKWQSGHLFANLGTFAVVERSSGDDTLLYAAQGGLNISLTEVNRLRFAAGYFVYTNTIGNPPFYNDRAKGNSVDADGNLIYDYEILELSTEYGILTGGWPVSVFGVFAQNTAVDEQNNAFALGLSVGSTNQRGDAQFRYAWHDTEADAVMGIFSDSDFGGGNTDSRGHIIRANYALRNNIHLAGTLIISEIEEFVGNRHDYDRIQLDLEFLFGS